MKYSIKLGKPLTHILKITLIVENRDEEELEFKLPIWRPGRYEAAHYSKNIQRISFENENDKALSYVKTSSSSWLVICNGDKTKVTYNYYAHKMDAGNSWYSEDQVYINFINCMLYLEDRILDKCEVSLNFDHDMQFACGLEQEDKILLANDYYQLVDSPLIASKTIKKITYTSHEIPFTIWMQGEHNLDSSRLTSDFKKFSDYQISLMGDFPEKSYHFLNQFTNYKHYHGVEHGNSTVICIGPGNELSNDSLYSELLGVSSHELFHAWNILKIRPKELLPYDYGRPPIFPTGFVAEGFTTYYGDLLLVQSGVFDDSWYFKELNILFKRHFHNLGRLQNSLIDSSIDLWVDGYQPSAPHKKSSIYVEGAMISLTLDLLIRKHTSDSKSLNNVMLGLWNQFGKKNVGYTIEDIIALCEDASNSELKEFFNNHVYGTKDLENLINELLSHVGCELIRKANDSFLMGNLGIKALQIKETYTISEIHIESVANDYFSIGDELLKIDDQAVTPDYVKSLSSGQHKFEIARNEANQLVELEITEANYYPIIEIAKITKPNERQRHSYQKWLNCSF